VNTISLQALLDRDRVRERLVGGGLSFDSSQARSALLSRCVSVLQEHGVRDSMSSVAHFVPGRIEVLGKHTDYAGGRSLLATPERGFCCVAVPRTDNIVTIRSAIDRSQTEFPFSGELSPKAGDWSNYPMTVARRLARNFPMAHTGADMAFASDLPIAAGMSSSSALIVATMLSLSAINHLPETAPYQQHIHCPEDLAAYLGCMENGQDFRGLAGDLGVGTFGGSEDHTAMLCARPGKWQQYAFCPVRDERAIEVAKDYLFAIGCSGVIAEKTGAARDRYNRLSAMTDEILKAWHGATDRHDRHLAAAIASNANAAERLLQAINNHSCWRYSTVELRNRFEHFLAESEEIIPSVPGCVSEDTIRQFGVLVDRSQESAENLLQNQTPETSYLARQARQRGALAASAFGAGFGGSVWALVRRSDATEFITKWRNDYENRFVITARRSEFFLTPAGPPVITL
jgi:galactokinase